MPRQMFLTMTMVMFALVSNAFHAASTFADEPNFVSNSSFEISESGNSLVDWIPSDSNLVTKVSAWKKRIHGLSALEFKRIPNPGPVQVLWADQLIQLQSGVRYIASANVKMEKGGFANLRLLGNGGLNESRRVDYDSSYSSWQKVEFEFTTQDASWTVLTCIAGVTDKPIYFDLVKVIEADSLLGVGSFENGFEGWNKSNGVAVNTTNSYFGSNSLRLDEATEDTNSYITKTVAIGVDGHKSAYKVSANIKNQKSSAQAPGVVLPPWMLGGSGGSPMNGPSANSDDSNSGKPPWLVSGEENREVPNFLPSGVGFKIDCFGTDEDGQVLRRTMRSPFFSGNCPEFIEREFHFLVPEWTVNVVIAIENSTEDDIAYVDNVRLTSSQVDDNLFIADVGHRFNAVEAPLAGTFVTVENPGSGQNEFDDLLMKICDVTDSNHEDYGKIVWLPEGVYSSKNGGVTLHDNLHIKIHPEALLSRGEEEVVVDDKYNFRDGYFHNFDQSIPIEDVLIEGGQYLSNGNQGCPVSIAGNRIVVRNMYVATWSNPDYEQNCFVLFGNDFSIHNNDLKGPGSAVPNQAEKRGYAGIQFWGGNRLTAMNNVILAGDDAIGLFPQRQDEFFDGPNPLFNYSITDSEFYNNILDSYGSEAFSCGLSAPTSDIFGGVPLENFPRLTSEVKNIRIRNFTGTCGGDGHLIAVLCTPKPQRLNANGQADFQDDADGFPTLDPDLESQVRNIKIKKAWIQADDEIETVTNGITLLTGDIGSLKDISISNVTVENMKRIGLHITKQAEDPNHNCWVPAKNQRISIEGCNIKASGGIFTYLIDEQVTVPSSGEPIEVFDLDEPVNAFEDAGPNLRIYIDR